MKNLSHLIKYLKKEMILNLVFKFLIQDVKDLAIYLGKVQYAIKGKNSWQTYAPSAMSEINTGHFQKS